MQELKKQITNKRKLIQLVTTTERKNLEKFIIYFLNSKSIDCEWGYVILNHYDTHPKCGEKPI